MKATFDQSCKKIILYVGGFPETVTNIKPFFKVKSRVSLLLK